MLNIVILKGLKIGFFRNYFVKAITAMNTTRNIATYCEVQSSYGSDKLIYPAANRNKEPILQVFKTYLSKYFSVDEPLSILEISSGSGQHVSHFAPHFPQATFQPSEYEKDLLGSIRIYAGECPTKNIKEPIQIDIVNDLSVYGFQKHCFDVIYNANMMHISPYECSIGLFTNCGKYLKPSGIMITYGPYAVDGIIAPESNVNFDETLRQKDSRWGIRDLNALKDLAKQNGITLVNIIDMPANNKCLIWEKLNKE